jgi:hypothetical protein
MLPVLGEYCPIISFRGKMSNRGRKDTLISWGKKHEKQKNPANAANQRAAHIAFAIRLDSTPYITPTKVYSAGLTHVAQTERSGVKNFSKICLQTYILGIFRSFVVQNDMVCVSPAPIAQLAASRSTHKATPHSKKRCFGSPLHWLC